MAKSKKTYSEALEELDQLLQKLEKNEVPLEDLTNIVKQATELIHFCQNQLFETDAEIQKFFESLSK
ncbi:MAG: exodeoxyribonuclease VII small subunit [Microbacter sp.]